MIAIDSLKTEFSKIKKIKMPKSAKIASKSISKTKDSFNLESLFKITQEKAKAGTPSTSYTAFLLASGSEKIAKKLVEEAFETAIASVEGKTHKSDKQQVILESADLIYHLFVLLISRKVELLEVVAELEKRSKSTGLKKSPKK